MSSRSSVPQSPLIPSEASAALGHLFAYAILAILLVRGLEHDIQSALRRYALAWLVSVLYGVSDEFHQSFVPGRHPSVADAAIDSAAAALGLTLMYAWLRLKHRGQVTSES